MKTKAKRIPGTDLGFVYLISTNIPPHVNGDLFVVEHLLSGRYRYSIYGYRIEQRRREEAFVENVLKSACIDQIHVPHENPFKHVVFTFRLYIPRYMFYWLMEAGGTWTQLFDGNKPAFQLSRRTFENNELKEPEDFPIQPGWDEYLYDVEGRIIGKVRKSQGMMEKRKKYRMIEAELGEAYDKIVQELTPQFTSVWQKGSWELRESLTPNSVYVRVIGTLSADVIIENFLFHARTHYRKTLSDLWLPFWSYFREFFPKASEFLAILADASFDAYEMEALYATQPLIFPVKDPRDFYKGAGLYDAVFHTLKDEFFAGSVRRTMNFLQKLERIATAEPKDRFSYIFVKELNRLTKKGALKLREPQLNNEDTEREPGTVALDEDYDPDV